MLSRVAESLYWLSRYLERAEHAARILAVHLNQVVDQDEERAAMRRHRLLIALSAAPGEAVAVGDDDLCRSVGFDLENPNSIASCIRTARENARQVREQINLEMWQQLNQLYLNVRNAHMVGEWDENDIEFFEHIVEQIQLFQGITDDTMNHGQGWHFIRIGRFLERAVNTAQFVEIEFNALAPEHGISDVTGEAVHLEWLALLKSCTAFEAYSKVYTFDLQPTSIAEFLMLNREFPHSINFSIVALQNALNALAEATETHKGARVYRLAGRLRSMLEFADIDEIMADGIAHNLGQIRQQSAAIHDALYQNYISYPVEEKLVS